MKSQGAVSLSTMIMVALGISGAVAFAALGGALRTTVVGANDAGSNTSVGSRMDAAISIRSLLRLADRLPEHVRAGFDETLFRRQLVSADHGRDAPGVGRALIPDALEGIAKTPHRGHSPRPDDGYAAAMREMSQSMVSGRPSAELRGLYHDALTKVVPNVLKAMRQEYPRAFAHYGTSGKDWLVLQKKAERLTKELRSRPALSANEIFEWLESFESAKYGRRVTVEKSFTPVFSETLAPATNAQFVDSMIAARELHTAKQPVLFPYEIQPPHGVERRFSEISLPNGTKHDFYSDGRLPIVLGEGSDRSRRVAALFDSASSTRWLPEQAQRNALVNHTFPGSRLYDHSPADARSLIAAAYSEVVTRRQLNKFGEWMVNVRKDLPHHLDHRQRELLNEITSLRRIYLEHAAGVLFE